MKPPSGTQSAYEFLENGIDGMKINVIKLIFIILFTDSQTSNTPKTESNKSILLPLTDRTDVSLQTSNSITVAYSNKM